MTVPKTTLNETLFPSYPLILDNDNQKYMLSLLKMYQLYYSIEVATLQYHAVHENHYVRLENEDKTVIYSWYEFLLYELIDLINLIHTETEGVYTKVVSNIDLLHNLDFEILWENIDDWAQDLSLDSFDQENDTNVEYVFKFFKGVEYYTTKNSRMPISYPTKLTQLTIEVDEYYGANVFFQENGKEEINTGVTQTAPIPLTGDLFIPQSTVPNPYAEKKAKEKERELKEPKMKEEVGEPKVDKVKVSLVKIKNTEYGIHTS
jgi:hypothetical protein